jgi:aspartyl/asparaginyl-tRNA synthetase
VATHPSPRHPILDSAAKSRLLSLRTEEMKSCIKIRSHVLNSTRNFMHENDFVEVACPTIGLAVDEVPPLQAFSLQYYDFRAMLSRSSQLYTQAYLLAYDKVWSMVPVFRKERKGVTHLSEFWYLHLEMADKTIDDVMDIIERMIVRVVSDCKTLCPRELRILKRSLEVPSIPFRKITFDEAYGQFSSGAAYEKVELKLTESLSRDHSYPFWVVNWPRKIKNEWYYYRNPESAETTVTMDLIYPEGVGEGASGGRRENRFNVIFKRMDKRVRWRYAWYLQLFRLGLPIHSGCGFGIERLCQWICGRKRIVDVVPFPRTAATLLP